MKKRKVQEIINSSHSLLGEAVIETAEELSEALYVFKIDELMKERGITQTELASISGMRIGTISDLVNGKGLGINKVQLVALMVALRVTDISEILEIRIPDSIKNTYKEEASEWVESRKKPLAIKERYNKNLYASYKKATLE
ncbi:helix-turn-helix domain-containing protein [Bacillus sp. NPDC077027]|uniref:helix-turn-helix domain-containing protein n=1 Tax=Bacillus sp. NPDC077027 TaxID=3390548 RepID=UPI003D0212F5